jgi:hypothetical protein
MHRVYSTYNIQLRAWAYAGSAALGKGVLGGWYARIAFASWETYLDLVSGASTDPECMGGVVIYA